MARPWRSSARLGRIVWYRGLFAFDANGIDLPAEMAVVDGDIELRVDTAGAEYPITIDPTISEEQELLALAPDDLEYFGSVGAIDEARGRMIVGGGATATVFELQAGVWTRVQELVPATSGPPPPGLGAQVVSSVDISGDIAVIGSIEFGTVAIYDRDAGGVWELSQTLASGDAGFGAAVGVGDGATVDFIMTGAPEEPGQGRRTQARTEADSASTRDRSTASSIRRTGWERPRTPSRALPSMSSTWVATISRTAGR